MVYVNFESLNQLSDLQTRPQFENHCITLFQLTLVMVFISAQWPLDGVLTLYQHDYASNTDLLNQMIRSVTSAHHMLIL